MIQVGSEKNGFIVRDIDRSQGYFEEWATTYSIEKDGFKRIAAFKVRFNGFGSLQCDGKSEKDCPQNDIRISIVKSSMHFGYFDLAVAETGVRVQDDEIKRMSRQFTLCFNGVAFEESACL